MYLVITRQGKLFLKVQLGSAPLILGRDLGAGILLPDPEVSRRHATIYPQDQLYWIEDLKSTRGTLLDGKPIQKGEIKDGSILRIGPFELRVTLTEQDVKGNDITTEQRDPVIDKISIFFETLPRDPAKGFPIEKIEPYLVMCDILRNKQSQLSAFLEIAKLINSVSSVERVLNSSMDFALLSTGAERGFIMLVEEKTGNLKSRVGRKVGQLGKFALPTISVSLAREVFESRQPKCLNNALEEDNKTQSIIANLIKSVVAVPLLLKDKPIGVIYLDHRQKENVFTPDEVVFLQSFANIVALALQNAQLYEETITDPLTGVFNKRYMSLKLEEEFNRAVRYHSKFAVLMMDLDHFKLINDTHGHPVGDEVLKVTARVARNFVRTSDVFGRFGGEEFIAVLIATDIEGAMLLAERLREEINKTKILFEGKIYQVTASIGVAAYGTEFPDAASLLKAADEELYRAKGEGRNRIAGRIQSV